MAPWGRFVSFPTPRAINSILVGGDEFFVDHICTLPCWGNDRCLDFGGLGGQTFPAGTTFVENGRLVEIRDLPMQAGGEASASTSNEAGHLGDELFVFKGTAFFQLGCASGLAGRHPHRRRHHHDGG
jgi:hypothetical protein